MTPATIMEEMDSGEPLEDETSNPGRFLPYPTSTLSPAIRPTDLSTFKSRGVGRVERRFRQKVQEIREEWMALIDEFNWNKLIYEARFSFEPIVGETYHLYSIDEKWTLSLISPKDWPRRKWIGTFRLGSDGNWQPLDVAPDFDIGDLADLDED